MKTILCVLVCIGALRLVSESAKHPLLIQQIVVPDDYPSFNNWHVDFRKELLATYRKLRPGLIKI